MKYIIDIPSGSLLKDDGYSFSDGNSYCITGKLSKLTPYTEPDRKAIEDEVWDFARRIICPSDCCEDSISAHTKEIFNKEGWEIRGIFNDLSYQEAKSKYEAWKKQKDEKETSELEEVVALANKLGIHKLYSLVKEIRGE